MREADLTEVVLRGMSERERRARAGLLHFADQRPASIRPVRDEPHGFVRDEDDRLVPMRPNANGDPMFRPFNKARILFEEGYTDRIQSAPKKPYPWSKW